jgi:hypothetical protein
MEREHNRDRDSFDQNHAVQNTGDQDNGSMIGGAVLIALGVIFMAQNIGGMHLGNWWAWFILVPAAMAFWQAYQAYLEAGQRVTQKVWGFVAGGLVPAVIGLIFLFNLNFGTLWPFLLIAAGAASMMRWKATR